MPALYRTYRPQTWEDLIGQHTVSTTLQQEIRTGRIAHAYLFSGPRGVGKTTSARLLAKALNCTELKEGSAEPCNNCASCLAINSSKALDMIELDAATHTGVDSVREHIIENAQARPMQLKAKVFIIDEVHRLSGSAFDALLKTLEEPPAHAFFILATTEAHKLPATILSRCQRFTFTHIAPELMKTRLQDIAKKEGATIDDQILSRVIARSGGCMRDAESLLDQLLSLGETITAELANTVLPQTHTSSAYPFVVSLLNRKTEQCLELLSQLRQQGVSMAALCTAIIEILRAVLVCAIAPNISFDYLEGFSSNREKLLTLCESLSDKQKQAILYYFTEAQPMIARSVITQLPLELATISAVRALGGPVLTAPGSGETETSAPKESTTPPQTDQEPPVESSQEPAPQSSDQPAPEEPKEQSQKAPLPAISGASSLGETELQTIWHKIKEQATKKIQSLGIIFTSAIAAKAENGTFVIQVPFPFHQDKLMEPDNKNLMETIISDITGKPFLMDVVILETQRDPEEQAAPLAQEVANAFGGEIIH